ncbi:hypothetical protein QBC45DRAFT_209662 [Copromyces sp. CBS 386.78]|nr:hypothetical protein QBC45DRAFT_209662 [Copromyces sp. CBS 386.78]
MRQRIIQVLLLLYPSIYVSLACLDIDKGLLAEPEPEPAVRGGCQRHLALASSRLTWVECGRCGSRGSPVGFPSPCSLFLPCHVPCCLHLGTLPR